MNKNRGGGVTSGHGRGRRPPDFQIWRQQGHYALTCPGLVAYAQHAPTIDAIWLIPLKINDMLLQTPLIGMLIQGHRII